MHAFFGGGGVGQQHCCLSPGICKCCINVFGTKQLFMHGGSCALNLGVVSPVPRQPAAELTAGPTKIFIILLQFGPCSGAVGGL